MSSQKLDETVLELRRLFHETWGYESTSKALSLPGVTDVCADVESDDPDARVKAIAFLNCESDRCTILGTFRIPETSDDVEIILWEMCGSLARERHCGRIYILVPLETDVSPLFVLEETRSKTKLYSREI